MMTSSSIRDLLEQAAMFERAGDPTGAVARARLAVAQAADEEARGEARIALARFEAAERAWRDEVEARARAFFARERREAGVVGENVSETSALRGRGPTRSADETRRARGARVAFA